VADLEALIRRVNDEVISQGKLEVVDELVADDLAMLTQLGVIPEMG
jgi:hypothetical protein